MKITLLACAFVFLVGCTQAPPPAVDNREADAKSILAVQEGAMKGWAARSAEQITSMYAPTSEIFFPNMPTLKGSDMAAALKDMLPDPNLSLKSVNTKIEVSRSGDFGYTQGTYEIIVTDQKTKKPVLEKGRYQTVFAKQADGGWKAVSDMNTPDGPATPVVVSK
jgi:ketosteroid isomerase-like protein